MTIVVGKNAGACAWGRASLMERNCPVAHCSPVVQRRDGVFQWIPRWPFSRLWWLGYDEVCRQEAQSDTKRTTVDVMDASFNLCRGCVVIMAGGAQNKVSCMRIFPLRILSEKDVVFRV